jgi:F-type H+-transporting ATPase subunit a
MHFALVAALLLAQVAQHGEPARGPVQEHKTAPVPESEGPRVTGHGVTPGKQEAAPGTHGERQHAGGHGEAKEEGGVAEDIFHHVEDEVWVPLGFWIGNRHVDVSITKHVINMWIAAGILLLLLAAAVRRRAMVPKGGYNLVETFVLFVRDEIAVKNIGDHASQYTPYLCSAFFFILFMNLAGLLPIPAIAGKFPGISTATGNLGVTVVLALFTFVVTQIAGMRAQGAIGYWAHLVPAGVPKWLFPIMVPVELLGLFTKPFALTVRLFANMVAGHIVIFFLIALTVLISPLIAPVSVAFALGIYLLELFVALVQAYVFTMLSAVFIGMTQHTH